MVRRSTCAWLTKIEFVLNDFVNFLENQRMF